MVRHAMTAYLHNFGHDEADTLVLIKAVLNRLGDAQVESEPSSTAS